LVVSKGGLTIAITLPLDVIAQTELPIERDELDLGVRHPL